MIGKNEIMRPKDKNTLPERMSILVVASEAHPFAQSGGLADAVSSLSSALCAMGHDVRIVMPRYGSIDSGRFRLQVELASMGVWMGDTEEWCSVSRASGDGQVTVYFIEHELYFNREGLYHGAAMNDYDDNPRRFGFFARAALQLCKDIGFKPHVVHVHDWQTALTAAYLKLWHWNDRTLGAAASVLTIHNIAYQGSYPKHHLPYLGLGWNNFTEDKFESYDQINFLKGGIYYADFVTTVSPTFAREITTPSGGFGLAPYIARRFSSFRGIVNGIDADLWNPQTDPLIPEHFSADSTSGKTVCKRFLQKHFDLAQKNDIALIGVVGRFVQQKGFELLARTIEHIVNDMMVQFVILGTGDNGLESYFGDLPRRYGGRIGSFIGFDNERAHNIIAGSDFLLMPSLFEPCGLTQLYAQIYGTLPIVRATGGLDDTVIQYDESTAEGTGFKFHDPTDDALYYTVGWAVSTYYDRPDHMKKMVNRAMKQDFSWHRQAQEYVAAYYQAMQSKKKWDECHRTYYR